ncbi:MAG TPA: sialidase family protein [Frankiaceae bacterium]|nr:sialidase family protein [Frankiaceae bacterium]
MKLVALRRVGLSALAAVPIAAAVVTLPAAEGAGNKSLGAGGITWSAAIQTDPQRDVGEPEIHIDAAGNIYTCGPSGFSNIADYAQVSTDGGDHFHLLGAPPRGQISVGEGGGDCGLASAPYKNSQGHYNFAYTGLGPLTNFSTATSSDTGKTFMASPVSESPPAVDRQWNVFTDAKTVLFNYNHQTQGYTVQKSVDGGLTYGAPVFTGNKDGRIGPMRAILDKSKDADKAIVYFPSYKGTSITLDISYDGGATWQWCYVIDAEVNPSAGFVVADHDTAGNVYIAYTEKKGDNDTYVTVVPRKTLMRCESKGDELGITKQHRVNRDKVETTVMPWVVAGDAGRVAVAFFGTDSIGDPDSGAFKASWYPYVSLSTTGLAKAPSWYQTKITGHPFHYGSICLAGLNCDLPSVDNGGKKAGDRSLADYFAMDLSPTTGRLHIVYGSSAKKPTDDSGHVSTATVVTQETGPSLLKSKRLTARRPAKRNTSSDRLNDATAPYSNLFVTPTRVNQKALDVQRVDVSPEIDLTTGKTVKNGGLTVTIKVRDLGDASLEAALQSTRSQSLVWLFSFLNGYQPAGATIAWSPVTGFTYGFDDYTTRSTESGQYDPTSEKIIVWPQATVLKGVANQDSGVLQLSIPRRLLKVQAGKTGRNQVPSLQTAKAGSVLFDATVWTMANPFAPVQVRQSYLYQVDQVPAMNVVVGKGRKAQPGAVPR